MPPIIPPPPPTLITGGDGGGIVVSGPWAIVIIGALIITALICVGIPIYGLYHDYWVMYKHERKMKKEYKKRRKSE